MIKLRNVRELYISNKIDAILSNTHTDTHDSIRTSNSSFDLEFNNDLQTVKSAPA